MYSSLADRLKIICLWTIIKKKYKIWQANVWQEKLSVADGEGLLARNAIFQGVSNVTSIRRGDNASYW